MKKLVFVGIACLFFAKVQAADFTTVVTLPANHAVGDYVEFVALGPIDAAASGYYEISISYTRNNLAAASTHIATVSHANPNIWREAGRINHNSYTYNAPALTIDCNSENSNPRLRLRVVRVQGDPAYSLPVNIKVRSINFNSGYTAINTTGNDLSVAKFVPMSSEWNLYVGYVYSNDGAKLALRARENGNVLIGKETQTNDSYKLDVAGKVRANEIVVNTTGADFVFAKDYKLRSLADVKAYIDANGHLPDVPPAKIMQEEGVGVSELQTRLLQKIEELTLYILSQEERLNEQQKQIGELSAQVRKGRKKEE